jgi:murein L,D-transpeptidase YcbB/YkuD
MVAAMKRGDPLWVAPRTPPGVFTVYATATVGPDGALRLLDDPYGEDPRLERALRTASDRLSDAHQERGRPESMWTKSSSG